MKPQDKARELRPIIEKAAISLSDEDALNAIELYPVWNAGLEYIVDKRIRYIDKLYRVLQTHISQQDWTPDVAVSLYVEVAKPGEIPVWKQPTGAQDAYNIGDLVYYPDRDGNIYKCLINNNVWSPDIYPNGWEKIS